MVLPFARQERLPAVEDRPLTKPLFLEEQCCEHPSSVKPAFLADAVLHVL
jgi:hypothetical protein